MGTDVGPYALYFAPIVDLCAELEQTTIPPRVKERLCRAFDRAIGKALCMSWDTIPDDAYINRSLVRHAERGARDFLP